MNYSLILLYFLFSIVSSYTSCAFQAKFPLNKTFALTTFTRNLRKSSSSIQRNIILNMSTRTEIDNLIGENKVMVFSKSYCPYCTRAKEAIRAQGVSYHAIELDVSPDSFLIDGSNVTLLFRKSLTVIRFKKNC